MGHYTEYLDRPFSFPDLAAERKKQLNRISELRGGRDVLVFAADLKKNQNPISISYVDLLPLTDQFSNLKGKSLDLILETPGGSGETAEHIIRLLRDRFESLGVIVPGAAKSAGTIMAMAADEILMEPASALGPIDAQLFWQGKVFSADALLKGFDRIKAEVGETGHLNKAYVPMLQGISPGELESAQNVLALAQELVSDWLARYKFKNWVTHTSTGKAVTEEERRSQAGRIARDLCDHGRWRTHARSITIADLQGLGLRITDYSKDPNLADAVGRYFTLLQITMDTTSIYKVYETPVSQIYKFVPSGTEITQEGAKVGAVNLICLKCGANHRIQFNLDKAAPLLPGHLPFPPDNKFKCPNCGTEQDLSDLRRQVELQTKKKMVG